MDAALARAMNHGEPLPFINGAESADFITDERLAVAALEDDRAYEFLVERYEKKLQRYIMRFIGCGMEDARDIVQESFVNAYRNLAGFDPDLKFSAWIYRIAHNEAVSHVRRLAARPTVVMEDEQFESLASELNVERDISRAMEAEHIRRAIGRLDSKYRDVIVLRYLEEKTYEEISDILRKPRGSVSSLISRAKEHLAELIRADHPIH